MCNSLLNPSGSCNSFDNLSTVSGFIILGLPERGFCNNNSSIPPLRVTKQPSLYCGTMFPRAAQQQTIRCLPFGF
jgi:hypothetical protein